MMRQLVVAALILVTGTARAATITEVHYVMGTYFGITVEHHDRARAHRAMRACFSSARALDERFSRFDPTSELSRLNASADDSRSVMVSAEMARLLRRALDLRARTHGTFDVSVGALTRLWRTSAQWPAPEVLAAARRTDGAHAFGLRGRSFTRRRGVLIDVDGVAKGWAVDRCVTQLRAAGVKRALLSFGESSLYAIGAPHNVRGWQVGLRGLNGEHAIGMLTLRDEAVSVSSVFGHERDVGPRRVGHIVDPRTGLALTTPAMAVIVASSATDAEAFSKAVLIEPSILSGGSRAGSVIGSLRVSPEGIRQTGSVPFRPFSSPRQTAAAEVPR